MTATLQAQAAAWTTLSVRVPGLLAGTLSPGERKRMVAEKAEAGAESAQAVGRAAVALMAKPRKGMPTPLAAFDGWLSLAEAASRPFHTRMQANGKRLGTKGRKRSG